MKRKIKLGDEVAPGKREAICRDEDGNDEYGLFGPLVEGAPMSEGTEIVTTGEADEGGWRSMNVLYRHGPAQVATPAYREGYDRIFGGKRKVAEA